MKNVVVVGSQWGDEGKGKIVDWLSDQADVVIRFQGGHNAGHTLVIDGITYKLRLDLIELFTYLVASSQDFFRVFPHEKNVEIADERVHPVPCVLLVVILLFFISKISFLLTKIS